MFHQIAFYLVYAKYDFVVFICFLITLETSKLENSSLFSFLKTFTMYDLIVLK